MYSAAAYGGGATYNILTAKIMNGDMATHNNNFLLPLSRLVQNWFYAIGSVYGITTISASVGQIKSAVWAKFTETV